MNKSYLRYVEIFIIVASFAFGTWIRWANLFNLGFVFDTLYFLYEWGKNVNEMGFIDFWTHYQGFIDYTPGSMYLLGLVSWFTERFGTSAHSFITGLKIVNWIADISLALTAGWVAHTIIGLPTRKTVLVASFIYAVPTLWFVSAIIGQVDPWVTTTAVMGVVMLEKARRSGSGSLWLMCSGFMLAASLWTKLTTVLFLPPIALYLLSLPKHRDRALWISSFLIGGAMILVVPAITNWSRLIDVLLIPSTRIDRISNGGNSLWFLFNLTGTANQPLLTIANVAISIKQAAIGLYACFSIAAVIVYLRKKIRLKHPLKLFAETLSLTDLFVILTIHGLIYFVFMTRVTARYEACAVVCGIFAAMMLLRHPGRKAWWLWTLLLNIAYVLNLISGYAWWGYTEPLWPSSIVESMSVDLGYVAAILNIVSLTGLMIWITRYPSVHITSEESEKRVVSAIQ